MTRLQWNEAGSRHYEAGVDRGAYFPQGGVGEVWNGLIAVKESPSESDVNTTYIDGVLNRQRRSNGSFSGTIEAFTYPIAFEENLIRRRPQPFGMTYRVMTDNGYKIHLVYNVLLKPSEAEYEQEDISEFSWGFTTLPIRIPGGFRSAHLVVDATKAYSWTVKEFEDTLYGSENGSATLPSPEEVFDIFETNALLQIIDNGDGTWTANGPDSAIQMLDDTTFQIDWPSAVYVDTDTYTIRSF